MDMDSPKRRRMSRSKSPKRSKVSKRSKSPKRSKVSKRSKSPKRKSPSPKKISVDPIALLSCNGLPLSDCRSRPFCSVVVSHNKKGKQIASFCRKKRVGKKSPKVKKVRKVKSPKAKSACQVLLKPACQSNNACGWIKRHAGRGGKMLASACRGVRRPKSPKAKSACQLMSKSHCVSNVYCGWIKRHLARPGGKMLPSACRGVRRKSL